MKRLSVKAESPTGLNTKIHDNYLGMDMTLKQAVRKVESGQYPYDEEILGEIVQNICYKNSAKYFKR